MKRPRAREDRHSYLGGDLPAPAAPAAPAACDTTDKVASFSSTNPYPAAPLSNKDKNLLRRESNKRWKHVDRKVGSGVDPNPRHTLYYRAQLPCLQEAEEWLRFQESLCAPLAVTFRLGACCPAVCALSIAERMVQQGRYSSDLFGVKRIDWLPCWQLLVDSLTLARDPAQAHLSAYLRREVALGHVVRQEMASMLPALLLQLQPHHTVLDVCAAPGSKTEQMLSLMGRGAPGMVVANDADPRRIDTLMRRYSRCGSPNLLVTCARAEDLASAIGEAVFDRIVADVPCSGDGTIRKFPHIWRLFRPRMALELHSIQLQIAVAAVRLLRPGGRIVYSTCSINPLEDEAVVAALLRHYGGALRLVPARLPGLQSRPGLRTWEVSQEVFSVGEPDDEARRATMAKLPSLSSSMYPPNDTNGEDDLHLEYCHRVLPQDQDMGGFFVAVMELAPAATILTTSGSSSSISSISREDSMRTMKQLGYNPAASRGGHKGVESVQYGVPPPHATMGFASAAHLGRGLQTPSQGAPTPTSPDVYLVQSARSMHLEGGAGDEDGRDDYGDYDDGDEDDGGNGIFGSRKNGWLKPTRAPKLPEAKRARGGDNSFLSLVSPAVNAALQSWATRVPLQKAGVEVGAICSASGAFRLHVDSARDVFRCMDPTDAASPCTALPLSEFAALCRQGARTDVTPTEEGGVDSPDALRLLDAAWSTRLQHLQGRSDVFLFARLDDPASDGGSDQPGEKRRLSKAERKALKQGKQGGNEGRQDGVRAPQSTFLAPTEGLLLVIRFSHELGLFCFVTPPDACASFAGALPA